ncbi:MAG: InlB B-repeat-containing protein [Clostridia bacterium]|nr:InlB B-repeat-containing protein [Clostridia bacterium]
MFLIFNWYTDAACTTKLAENATVGAQVVNLYAKTTAGTFTANFWLDDAKTELYYTANVVFDKEIRLPDTLEAPTKTGYIFAGWDPYVGLMDEEGKDFVAIWYENDVVTATFYVDGAVYEMFDNLTYGAEMEIPAPPVKAGHRFDGWALKGTTDIVDLQGTTVPAESVEYEAIFTITEFYVTYNNYVASEFGPAGTPTPAYEAYAIDGVAVKNAYNLNDAIVHPAAPVVAVIKDGTTHTEYYTFSHWEDADGNVWADGAAMPANDVALYAKYDRATVQLAVVEGSTGVLEKANATDMEQWYAYGFAGRRINSAEVPKLFTVQGDGYYVIENSELSGTFGTGAKIVVYDRLTNEFVEEYYIIIFGDVDGNARIDVNDSSAMVTELASPTWSNRRNGVPYRIKAADLDLNRRIDTNDSTRLINAIAGEVSIDQTTGEAK